MPLGSGRPCVTFKAGCPDLSRVAQGAGNPLNRGRWTRPRLRLRLGLASLGFSGFPAPTALGTGLRPPLTTGLGSPLFAGAKSCERTLPALASLLGQRRASGLRLDGLAHPKGGSPSDAQKFSASPRCAWQALADFRKTAYCNPTANRVAKATPISLDGRPVNAGKAPASNKGGSYFVPSCTRSLRAAAWARPLVARFHCALPQTPSATNSRKTVQQHTTALRSSRKARRLPI